MSLKDAIDAAGNAPKNPELREALCLEVYLNVRDALVGRIARTFSWYDVHDRSDLVQQTLYEVFRKAIRLAESKKIDLSRGEESVSAYVRRIASNELSDQAEKLFSKKGPAFVPLLVEVPDEDEKSSAKFDFDPRINHAFTKLSAEEKLIIKLRILDDMRYKEIGASLGISAGAARVRLSRAIKALRQKIEMQS